MKILGKTKENKAITLIALVITIIVLLILAAVSIATLTGQNGILTKAGEAKTNTKKAEIEEQVRIAILASYDDTGKLDYNKMIKNLKEIDGVVEGLPEENTEPKYPVNFTVDGYSVNVYEDGTIDVGDKEDSETVDVPAPDVSIEVGTITKDSIQLIVTATDEESGLLESGAYQY